MHSIRWRYSTITVILVFFHSIVGFADASDAMQKPISMTADGWKPIIGSSHPHPTNYQEEIKYYQNPILKETVRAETLPTTTPLSTQATTFGPEGITKQSVPIPIKLFNQGTTKGKIPPHTKQSPQYYILPRHGGHGPHIPLNAVTQGRPGLHGVLKKGSIKGLHGPNRWVLKKPLVSQLVSSQSSRNEVYVPAPSSGSHSHIIPSKNVRTRESIGLGTAGHKIFSNKSPHSQLEYSSHFPPKNLFHQNSPVQHVIYQKQQANEIIPPYQIDTHQNLLPPPIFKSFEKNQLRNSNKHLNPEIHTPNDKIIFGHNPLGPNDLILQLPSYDQSLFDYGKQKQNPSIVQVTKEKLKTFHNDIPQKFSPHLFKDFDNNFHSFHKPITEYPKSATYEVTENKWDDNTPVPNKFQKPNIVQPVELNFPPFLPTPYKPDISISTSPTQEDVSTIFGQLSNNVKQYSDVYTHDPYLFDVKEVSTHYPILGTPGTVSTIKTFPDGATGKPVAVTTTEETLPTTELSKVETIKPLRPHSNNRRRRPTTRYTTTTEQATEVITENETTSISSYSTEEIETERPHRSRRPINPRPALSNSDEESVEVPKFNRIRDRHRKRPHQGDLRNKQYRKRVRPNKIELEEEFTTKLAKAKLQEEDATVLPIVQHFTTQNAIDVERDQSASTPRSDIQTEYASNSDDNVYTKGPNHYYSDEEYNQEIKTVADNNNDGAPNKNPNYNYAVTAFNHDNRDEENVNFDNLRNSEEDEIANDMNEEFKPQKVFNITETTVNLLNPSTSEFEIESTTAGTTDIHSSFGISDISKSSTSEQPTTEITTTSTKPHRRRPIKYSASNRPRFSVKDYRQRLNQYSSTSTSTESTKISTESVRLRFPTRLRRPLPTTATTTQAAEETTRTKFVPKEPRHSQTNSGNHELLKENNVKAVNTRLRPFGRVKSTTEQSSTVSSKVSIKPNLFSNRRRPPPIGFKSRFANKNKTDETEVKENDLTTIINNVSDSPSVELENPMTPIQDAESDDSTTIPSDILKNDALMYSQRVSDLTSSMKNAYEGFKTVPTSSRRIPNFYSLSTEDPILPIEAFFSNINDKDNMN
ncbi:hypothetical protein WA026_011776 [Henosepilachna vigintioctopunctata]|uniref:Uncharacterized protein n=1 Tax=Henosepilachna vigintioctopunctata TaxID=420089 RepID=A0AAW1UIM9_9CUCU